MAQSLLTNAQQTYIDSLYDTVFATFKRQIQIVSEGKTTVIQSNPSGTYNPSYKKQNTKTSVTEERTTIDSIVEYSPTVTDQMLQQVPELKALQNRGLVRISIGEQYRTLIERATDIQFDGHSFQIETGGIPRTIFGVANYYDYWLILKN